jgi:asparagine N-glycosylation enzyme membrane subunit Stt3
MEIVKSLFLGIWLISFGTIAYLYLAYRRLPPSTMVSPRVFAAYTTYSVLWWAGVAACFVLAFLIVKSWPGRPIFWVTLAVTELLPVGLLAMFLALAARNKEVIDSMKGMAK